MPEVTVSTFGLTESDIGSRLDGFAAKFPGVRLDLHTRFPEVYVKLYASGKAEKELNNLIENASKWALQRIGKWVFSVDGSSMEAVVGSLLRKKKATLSVAESCTGGLVSHWLTNVPGSSDYFLFSGVTYSNEAKIKILGVSPATLRRYGAVHEETVKEMAEGAQHVIGATYSLSISGIAGPTGGTVDRPAGTVCIGLATPCAVKGYRFNFPFDKRSMNKRIFAMTALDLLRQELLRAAD